MRLPGMLGARLTDPSRSVVAAVDQGTTSTRCILFNRDGARVASAQIEHRQILPAPGHVEHNPIEIWDNTRYVLAAAMAKAEFDAADVAAVGITNQRETTIVWDRTTGRPIHNAIVWQDTRTDDFVNKLTADIGADRIQDITGLPPSTYFSGPKIARILDHVPGARARAEAGELLFGTVDSWLVWNLTRKDGRALHVTDVTNASRTLLMDITTMQWSDEMCQAIGVPQQMLPQIVSSSEILGRVRSTGPMHGVPIAGILGDQQAATFGQACLSPGEAKNTYGTGNFLLMNTGTELRRSNHGLLSTVAYKLGDQPVHYALEGSIAVTGSLVQWLRDNVGLISSSSGIEALARTVPDNGGLYIVPAFSGLLAPHWRSDARGVFVGLTSYVNKGHIARAVLEATAYQTREVVEAMNNDAGTALQTLKVDGGMTANDLLMQFQADILGVPVVRPVITETTALGAAYAAGLATGFWDSTEQIRQQWKCDKEFSPHMDKSKADQLFATYGKAVTRTFDWQD